MADKKNSSDSLPQAVSSAASDLSSLQTGLAHNALTEALPVPDIMFGGGVLLLVVMFHAFWIRLITGSFLKRSQRVGALALLWRADLLFALMVMALLALHLAEVVVWSAALMLGASCPIGPGPPTSRPTATPRSASRFRCRTLGASCRRSLRCRASSPSPGQQAYW